MKKITALAISSMILLNSTSFAFSDLKESHWAYNSIMYMQKSGIISGFEDNTFRPSDTLTREQFITMAVKGLNVEKPYIVKEYEDLGNRWSKHYVETAGYTICDNDVTKFNPTSSALREDVAMSIVRLKNLEKAEYSLETLNKFSDSNTISDARKKYVAIAVEHGFMSGNANGTFAPKKALTRAEGATVVLNMLNNEQIDEISNWNCNYISNVDGLVKVQLRKISDTEVNFYIKGKKSDFFGTNNNAIIDGETATYKYSILGNEGEMIFRFEDSDLIIETSGYEGLADFAGRYKVDNGTTDVIERSVEKSPLEGIYTLGVVVDTNKIQSYEEYEKIMKDALYSIRMKITNITDNSATIFLDGIANGNMVIISGNLIKEGNKWKYFDNSEQKYVLEIELKDGWAIVTGLNTSRRNLSGTYNKVAQSLADEYKEYEDEIDMMDLGEGIFINNAI